MLVQIFFAVVVTAAPSRKPDPTVSPKCEEEFMKIQTEGDFAEIQACEEKNKYHAKVISHLQNDAKSDAISIMEEQFQECAKMSKKCAEEIAPVLVQEIQLSGEAVTKSCEQATAKVRNDKEKMKEVESCQGKYVKQVQAALSKDHLNSAMDAMETSLKKCWGLSEKCAAQMAPIAMFEVDPPPQEGEKKYLGRDGRPLKIQPGGRPMGFFDVTRQSATLTGNNSEKLSLIEAALNRRNVLQKTNATHLSYKRKRRGFVLTEAD